MIQLPTHYCVGMGCIGFAELLLSWGIDLTTAECMATNKNLTTICKLFITYP